VGASAASASLTFSISDANGVAVTKTLALTVNPVPSISTSSLPTATVGQTTYAPIVAATGGTTPYQTWSISSGSLPSGLSINSMTGIISGPVGGSPGNFTFTVKVVDANAVAGTKSLTITVSAAPSVTTTSLATATDSQTNYSQTLAATGGTGSLTWSVSGGTLPAGLTLNASTGAISGSDVTGTTQTFTVAVMDTNAVTATKSLTITVYAAPAVMTASPLPAGTHGVAYTTTLAASGGAPALTWSVSTGTLPTGLTLNSSSGVISGTVASPTTGSFTITVTDADGVAASKAFTITFS
jgi:hypothetical protein